jgi:hypothetical protein
MFQWVNFRELFLGSSHAKGIGPMLRENVDTKFYVFSIFKPNAPLAKIARTPWNLLKALLIKWEGQETDWT